MQNDDYSQTYDIASSGNYVTIEAIDDGTYYYTFIIENNDFYLDKFSMEKYNQSDLNKKEEEHYYNYKKDAAKFNHTNRIKAIDLERGFFNNLLIEEYNK